MDANMPTFQLLQMLGQLMVLVVGSSHLEEFLSWSWSRASPDANGETDAEYRHFQCVGVSVMCNPPAS